MGYAIHLESGNILSGLRGLGDSYTDLGSALQGIFESQLSDVKSVLEKSSSVVSGLKESLGDSSSASLEQSLSELERSVGKLGKSSLKLDSEFKEIGKLKPSSGMDLDSTGDSSLVKGLDTQPNQAALDKVTVALSKTSADMDKRIKDDASSDELFVQILNREAKTISGLKMKAASSIPSVGGFAGGFFAGLLAVMVGAQKEKFARQQEMGEMANVFARGADEIASGPAKRAKNFFGQWAIQASRYYGVGKAEVQETVGVLLDHGFTSEEIRERYSAKLGEVGRNIVLFSLGVAKHYNMSSSETVSHISKLVEEYGYGLQEAGRNYEGLFVAAERTGMGVQKFVEEVFNASKGLALWGININTVANVMGNISDHFKSLGLNDQYSGGQAVQVTMDLMNAFTRMNDQFRVMLGRKMFGDKTDNIDEMRIMLMDGLARASKGEDDAFLENMLKSMFELISAKTSGSRGEMISELQGMLPVDNRTASVLIDMGKNVANGGRLADQSKESQALLKKAFQVESEQVNQLEKMQKRMVEGMMEVGLGLMAVLTDLVSLVLVGVKGLIAMARGISWSDLATYEKVALGAIAGGSLTMAIGLIVSVVNPIAGATAVVSGAGAVAGGVGLAWVGSKITGRPIGGELGGTIISQTLNEQAKIASKIPGHFQVIMGGLEKTGNAVVDTFDEELDPLTSQVTGPDAGRKKGPPPTVKELRGTSMLAGDQLVLEDGSVYDAVTGRPMGMVPDLGLATTPEAREHQISSYAAGRDRWYNQNNAGKPVIKVSDELLQKIANHISKPKPEVVK